MSPPPPFKGSRLRIAEWVGARPEWLITAAGLWPSLEVFRAGEPMQWLSPLAADGWVEFRDETWQKAGLPWPSPQRAGWWPSGGPQWDAVAVVPGAHSRRGVL